MGRFAAWLLWLAYGRILRRKGVRFQEFELRWEIFLKQLMRPPAAAAYPFDRREIRARW
jgi:hypothetical protein